jgi:hypothetical protein
LPSRGPFVVTQQTAQPGTPTDPALGLITSSTLNQPIPEPLMVPLTMIVIDELGHGSSEMALSQRQHSVEAFLFDRPHEPFSEGIRIRGLPRRQHHANATIA